MSTVRQLYNTTPRQ